MAVIFITCGFCLACQIITPLRAAGSIAREGIIPLDYRTVPDVWKASIQS